MTRSLFAVLALFVVAGCSQQVPGAASPDPVVMQEIAACESATDDAVTAGLAWLGDLEIQGADASGPDTVPFTALGQACRGNPDAWSNFIIRTHAGFEPVTVMGQFAAREFLTFMCTQNNTSPDMQLTTEARRVCAGG